MDPKVTIGVRRKEYEWKMRETGKWPVLVNRQTPQPEENIWETLLAGLAWAALIGLLVSLPYVAIRLGW